MRLTWRWRGVLEGEWAEASACVALGGTCRDLTRSAILLRHTMRCAAILAKKLPARACQANSNRCEVRGMPI